MTSKLAPVRVDKVEVSKGEGLGRLVDVEEGRRRLHAIAVPLGLLPKTSKRRRRRLRGKLRAKPDEAEYGPETLAVLAPLIDRDNRRRPFTTAELSPEQVELIAQSKMDPRHDHLNKLLD